MLSALILLVLWPRSEAVVLVPALLFHASALVAIYKSTRLHLLSFHTRLPTRQIGGFEAITSSTPLLSDTTDPIPADPAPPALDPKLLVHERRRFYAMQMIKKDVLPNAHIVRTRLCPAVTLTEGPCPDAVVHMQPFLLTRMAASLMVHGLRRTSSGHVRLFSRVHRRGEDGLGSAPIVGAGAPIALVIAVEDSGKPMSPAEVAELLLGMQGQLPSMQSHGRHAVNIKLAHLAQQVEEAGAAAGVEPNEAGECTTWFSVPVSTSVTGFTDSGSDKEAGEGGEGDEGGEGGESGEGGLGGEGGVLMVGDGALPADDEASRVVCAESIQDGMRLLGRSKFEAVHLAHTADLKRDGFLLAAWIRGQQRNGLLEGTRVVVSPYPSRAARKAKSRCHRRSKIRC